MDTITILITSLAGLLVGGGIGFFLKKNKLAEEEAKHRQAHERIKQDADAKAKEMLFDAQNEALKMQEQLKKEERKKREELRKTEQRVLQKEEQLDKKLETSDKKREELEQKIAKVEGLKKDVEALHDEQKNKLESVASLSKEDAKKILLDQVEKDIKKDLMATVKRVEKEVKDEADNRAKMIIAEAISRYAAETTMESTATIVSLPSDDMKGRIIGREGRNINAFEQATGIDVIVDDTPGSIVISGYDLIRRHVAKVALEKLISDGRIHPARIEEVVRKTKEEVNTLVRELGEKTVFDVGVAGLHPDLIKLLGRLKFRVSLSQNVLQHSIEVAYLAGLLASEVGADVEIAKKAGLLHDIGKAVDHEISGHHALIGRDILKKYNVGKEVIHCVEAHHDHIKPESAEAKIVQAANMIANARPGAKKDNLEAFIKRLSDLENVAATFEGVDKSYAIQAGKEVRIFVNPEKVDDELKMTRLSHDIARKIEKDLKYPGQIKVEVLREKRVESFAT